MSTAFDEVTITVTAGSGGNGKVSFRREKFVPYGGPDGGDGGRGGSLYLIADPELTAFLQFRHRRSFKADNGGNGGGKKMHGASAEDLYIKVPPGTIVTTPEGEVVADLDEPGKSVLVARGGRGGLGNVHFATPTNQVPRIAQKGEPGESREFRLELKLIADVGIVGYPNVGKSTFLAAVSRARPKVGPYPFTTLAPNLGVATIGDLAIVLADIPGLIEGAHLGTGLGDEFLRHIVRTRVLIHIVDGTSASPLIDYDKVNAELREFDPALAAKPQIVAINKLDLPEVQERWPEIQREFEALGLPAFAISAATGEGVAPLLYKVAGLLPIAPPVEVREPILRPAPRHEVVAVAREGEAFRVAGKRIERLAAMADLSSPEGVGLFRRALSRMGVARALERAGAKPGDLVKVGSVELRWG